MAIINGVAKDINCTSLVLQRQREVREEVLKLSSNQTSTPSPCLDQNNIAKGKELGKLDTLGQLSSFGWKPGENNQDSQQATPFQRQSESRSDQEHQENERATKKCCTIM